MEKLIIAGREFNSRLFLGTGKFSSNAQMKEAIIASATEMVTVAMKRVDLNDKEDDLLNHILNPNIQLLQCQILFPTQLFHRLLQQEASL